MPETTENRGFAILEDASGRRARWLRRAGRLVFVIFLAWLAAILLGGFGLTPVPQLPFAHTLRPSPGPTPVKLPPPAPTPAADLVPALPAAAVPISTKGRSATAPGRTKTTTTATTRGRSSTAPGHTKTITITTHGRSGSARGHTKTTTTTTVHGRKKLKP